MQKELDVIACFKTIDNRPICPNRWNTIAASTLIKQPITLPYRVVLRLFVAEPYDSAPDRVKWCVHNEIFSGDDSHYEIGHYFEGIMSYFEAMEKFLARCRLDFDSHHRSAFRPTL